MSFMGKVINFFKEVREELDKVVWPSRQQTIQLTTVVIAVTLAVGGFIGGIDYLLTLLTKTLLKQ